MKLALGTAQFGMNYGVANRRGQVSRREVREILDYARAQGIDTIDTAIGYGDSEASLGEAGVNDFRIVTKLPAVPDDAGDLHRWVDEQVLESLRRLRCESLYALLLHRPQQLTGPRGRGVADALRRLKERGLVKKIGASIYAPAELETLFNILPPDLVQAPFNLIDRRLHGSGWLQKLYDGGVEVHARSVFLQGLLLMPLPEMPAGFQRWSQIWESWHDWLFGSRVSAVQACLAFVQSFPQFRRIVVGVDSPAQLRQVVEASHVQITVGLPLIACSDETLLNPSRWSAL